MGEIILMFYVADYNIKCLDLPDASFFTLLARQKLDELYTSKMKGLTTLYHMWIMTLHLELHHVFSNFIFWPSGASTLGYHWGRIFRHIQVPLKKKKGLLESDGTLFTLKLILAFFRTADWFFSHRKSPSQKRHPLFAEAARRAASGPTLLLALRASPLCMA